MYSSRGGLQPEYRATGSVSRKRKQRRVAAHPTYSEWGNESLGCRQPRSGGRFGEGGERYRKEGGAERAGGIGAADNRLQRRRSWSRIVCSGSHTVEEMAAASGGAPAAASGGGRSADHIAWEQSVKDAAANGGHKPDEHGEYRCRCASCSARAVRVIRLFPACSSQGEHVSPKAKERVPCVFRKLIL